MAPLDDDHVRAKITWSEQDVGGGKLVVEVTVKNTKTRPKTDDQLRSDARALAVRFARAFADTIENSRRSTRLFLRENPVPIIPISFRNGFLTLAPTIAGG